MNEVLRSVTDVCPSTHKKDVRKLFKGYSSALQCIQSYELRLHKRDNNNRHTKKEKRKRNVIFFNV